MHKEQDGWTRGMYTPKEKDFYLVKIDFYNTYEVCYWNGKNWVDLDVVAWRPIPKTSIETIF